MDKKGKIGGVLINNSIFNNCHIIGIVKAEDESIVQFLIAVTILMLNISTIIMHHFILILLKRLKFPL
jgi:hypothetical protein